MKFRIADTPRDETQRTFNHDLNLDVKDQEFVRQRWPLLADVLIDPEAIQAFCRYEAEAKLLKHRVQRVGSVAVILMLASLLGTATQLWLSKTSPECNLLRFGIEVSAITGLLCAVLASRYGPWRRRWLRNRFMTETLRQWHFRGLLEGSKIDKGCGSLSDKQQFIQDRQANLSTLLYNLQGTVGQKMDHLAGSNSNILGVISASHLPTDSDVQFQLLEAYRILRINHQLDYSTWKLSIEDKTFLGVSSFALVHVVDQLSGATLLVALVLSAMHLFISLDWVPFAAVSFAMMGIAVRAWRDGLALSEERERYQEMQHRLELIVTRWEVTSSNEKRFRLAEEVEQLAVEELRTFIRAHEKAQFVF